MSKYSLPMKDRKHLNIGCGETFSSLQEWTNIDCLTSSPNLICWDITRCLPFSNNLFDYCYSSHLLEHLTQNQAKNLLIECLRVLKSDGIIRLVVPDLEVIARNYLSTLEQSLSGNDSAQADYDWMMLELFDQMVRNHRGGEMGIYLSNPNMKNKDFVFSRIGHEAELYCHKQMTREQTNILTKLKSQKLSDIVKRGRIAISKFFVYLIAGQESADALEIGLFRNSGEIHQWMYDRFSLTRLLKECGFVSIKICQANESRIPDFNSYSLDIIDGKVRKPDSLFIEALKP